MIEEVSILGLIITASTILGVPYLVYVISKREPVLEDLRKELKEVEADYQMIERVNYKADQAARIVSRRRWLIEKINHQIKVEIARREDERANSKRPAR
jgi:hypothetical protein